MGRVVVGKGMDRVVDEGVGRSAGGGDGGGGQ